MNRFVFIYFLLISISSYSQSNILVVAHQAYQNKNCNINNELKKIIDEDSTCFSDNEEYCRLVDLDLIKVTTADIKASKKINSTIIKSVCSQYSTIEEMLNSVDSGVLIQTFESNVELNEKGIFCLKLIKMYRQLGCYQTRYSIACYNFNIQTGKQLFLEDILIPGYKKEFKQICKKIFCEANNIQIGEMEEKSFKIPDNFCITPTGLLFIYNYYENGGGYLGWEPFLVPYKKTRKLLKKDGVIKVYL